jgi:hypothetical protein
MTHSFQAPKFYEHLGYDRKFEIEGRPRGHTDIVYAKRLKGEGGSPHVLPAATEGIQER